jgi:hypothetical protein
MRRIAVALGAVLALAVAAVAYGQAQQNTYTVTGSTSPTKAGSAKKPVPVGVKFGYQVGEASGNRPSPVKRYSIRFAGLRANTDVFPTCSTATLDRKGPSACPKGAIVGEGFIENATGAKDNPNDRSIQCNARLWVVNGGKGRANIYVKGSPGASNPREKCAIELAAPIPAKFVKRGNAQALEFDVPQSLLHPLPTLDNAVVNVTSTIKRVTRRGKGFFESVGGCKGGKRDISVVFTPESGSQKTASTKASCSR